MDDNCGEWVECMGVARGYSEQEVGVASGIGWNLWVWLYLYTMSCVESVLFCSSILLFVHF